MSPPIVHIHYLRPPDRKEVFHQLLIHDRPDVKITFAQDLVVEPARRIRGEVALESGSDVVWFTFPGAWHDIGRFHSADGSFRGFYANILTPPTFHPGGVWRTTDLFLDVWLTPGGTPLVLDREELEEASREGWIAPEVRRRALREVDDIFTAFANGAWPPEVTRRWTRERAIARANTEGPGQPSSGSSSPTT